MFSKVDRNRTDKRYTNGAVVQQAVIRDDVPSIIAADLRIVGNLICSGSIEIEGEIEGNVSCGRVSVRRTGAIKGDVAADEIHVDGEIRGLVKGKSVTITESGRVIGMVVYESLAIKDGGYIEGQCQSIERSQRKMEALEMQTGKPSNLNGMGVHTEEEHVGEFVEG
jgi:cytoskeletal protein CcmA (bactofilin family)